ncbi:tripartite tricarboxylate transporter permease, partial [Pseudomonas stutzeri]|nr:tripartite tricarboxylate transporter permease [Stutzerimonas stutzeri]
VNNAMLDVWFMLLFGVIGYVLKKLSYPLAPMILALVLGDRMEDAFRQSMLGPGTGLHVFWSNSLVGTISTLALLMLFWPLVPVLWNLVRKSFGGGKNGGAVGKANEG